MVVVDASCLYEALVGGTVADAVRSRLATDAESAAPHLVDAEVLSLIRRDHVRGALDPTASRQAVEDLRTWPGTRYGHRPLLERAFELRDALRAWDALYIALAEALQAPLITLDRRLQRATGLGCPIEVLV